MVEGSGETLTAGDLFDPSRYTRVDPRAMTLERVNSLITTAVVVSLCVAGTVALYMAFPWSIWVAGPGTVGVLVFFLWGMFYYDPRAFAVYGYRLDDRVLAIRAGVWWRSVRLIPLTRVQHADISVGPIQKRFGLATLQLHTAASGMNTVRLTGLAIGTAESLRETILSRLEPGKKAAGKNGVENEVGNGGGGAGQAGAGEAGVVGMNAGDVSEVGQQQPGAGTQPGTQPGTQSVP